MAEPIVPSSQQSADIDNNNETVAENLPKNAEDRAAAVALSSLKTNEISASGNDAGGPGGAKLPSAADQEALGKAMSRLELIAGTGAAVVAGKKDAKKGKEEEGKTVAKKKAIVKVSAEDVMLLVSRKISDRNFWDYLFINCMGIKNLHVFPCAVVDDKFDGVAPLLTCCLQVDQLDLTKVKATELLKAHEGDPVKAIRAFIAPPRPA